MSKKQKIIKRILDVILSLLLLPLLTPVLIVLIIIATFDTGLFGVFTQERVGLNACSFSIFKIRTLNKEGKASRYGRFLRKYKLDEFLQIINVLIGNMSFVGPRPDIKGFADTLKGEDRIILSVKPGITGPASIELRNEEAILMEQSNPEEYNLEYLWKRKVELNKEYVQNYSVLKDVQYMVKTVLYVG